MPIDPVSAARPNLTGIYFGGVDTHDPDMTEAAVLRTTRTTYGPTEGYASQQDAIAGVQALASDRPAAIIQSGGRFYGQGIGESISHDAGPGGDITNENTSMSQLGWKSLRFDGKPNSFLPGVAKDAAISAVLWGSDVKLPAPTPPGDDAN